MFAVRIGFSDITKLLIDKGADVNRVDRYGWTALRFAQEHNYPEIVQLLESKLKS